MPLAPGARDAMVEFLEAELGTSDIGRARTYMEDPLRMVSHLIMSTPGVSDQLVDEPAGTGKVTPR